MKEIIVIGGGASGIAAALSAAKADPSAHVTLLEGLDRVGKKILATGNGRCNLTNEHISPEHYHSGNPGELAKRLEAMPVERTLDFFRSLGLFCAAEEMGRVYPYSRQASMVLDVLLLALERSHVNVVCGSKVTALHRAGREFQVKTDSGKVYRAGAVVLTTGGKAAPKQGSDGSGYALAQHLGHHVTPLFPCLVALKCFDPVLKGLKGIRAQGKATLLDRGRPVAWEAGELQFTDYGLSGIPAFQLSCHLGAKSKHWEVSVDLLPDWTSEELLRHIRDRIKQYPSETLERFLLGLVHKKLLYSVMKAAAVEPLSRQAKSLSPRDVERLAACLKDWRFQVTGTLDWNSAQVTGGGVPLDEIDGTFQSKRCGGLYLAGEILDVVGDCGGFNLHWAWCSGMAAGAAVAGRDNK